MTDPSTFKTKDQYFKSLKLCEENMEGKYSYSNIIIEGRDKN